ncbi:MAG: glycosyltransferase family 4 protein [Bacteroidales bacterium]
MHKILFITLVDASFVRLDKEILREEYDITTFQFRYRKGWRVITELIRELFFVFYKIWSIDVVYIWFADFHAVIPSLVGHLLGKKVVIVVGGYDAANRKDLNYGVKTKFIGRISALVSLKMATHLLPVTQFTMEDLIANFGEKLRTKCRIIYNSYNQKFHCEHAVERSNTVVTVCLAHSEITVIRKGVDFFVALAHEMPDITFMIIGLTSSALSYVHDMRSANVQLIGKIPQEKLIEILCSSRVICQFSRYEAFGVALLEGIAAGCFPVGFDYGGTSEILKAGQGLLIDELSVEKGITSIKQALNEPADAVKPIQNSISKRFSIDVRQKALVSFISEILDR